MSRIKLLAGVIMILALILSVTIPVSSVSAKTGTTIQIDDMVYNVIDLPDSSFAKFATAAEGEGIFDCSELPLLDGKPVTTKQLFVLKVIEINTGVITFEGRTAGVMTCAINCFGCYPLTLNFKGKVTGTVEKIDDDTLRINMKQDVSMKWMTIMKKMDKDIARVVQINSCWDIAITQGSGW